ncbi:MAG: hypothetical protein KAS99_02255 [Candidatus Omnitrophica bacterium]|nr:hypothetical protein [Candidatus Omnitrophota bacterium]
MNSEKTKAIAAAKAGMDVRTATKYVKLGKLPNKIRKDHDWRTRAGTRLKGHGKR